MAKITSQDIAALIKRAEGPDLDAADQFAKDHIELVREWHCEVALSEAAQVFDDHMKAAGSNLRFDQLVPKPVRNEEANCG